MSGWWIDGGDGCDVVRDSGRGTDGGTDVSSSEEGWSSSDGDWSGSDGDCQGCVRDQLGSGRDQLGSEVGKKRRRRRRRRRRSGNVDRHLVVEIVEECLRRMGQRLPSTSVAVPFPSPPPPSSPLFGCSPLLSFAGT